MNIQNVNDAQESKESVSEISIPLITKFGFSAGGFVLVVLKLLILDSVKDFPQLWKNIIHWPWNVYHGIFGAIFVLIMAEFFWIYKQNLLNYLNSGLSLYLYYRHYHLNRFNF